MDYLYPLEIASFFNVDPLQDFEDTYLIEHGSGMDGSNFEEGKANGDSNGQDVSMISLVVVLGVLMGCMSFLDTPFQWGEKRMQSILSQ